MLNNTIDHPIALALLISSGLLAAPMTLVSLWRERRHSPGALRNVATLGAAQLALLWLGLIPLALLNRALGEPFVAVFGSYSQSTSLIDYAAAANLIATCLLLVRGAFSSRWSCWLRAFAPLVAVILAFTAAEEAGLDKLATLGSFPSDALHSPFVPVAYSLGGLLILVTALVIVGAGERVTSRSGTRVAVAIMGAPHVIALGLTTATLAQHPLFEEVAELAFAAALLQVLAATAFLMRSARAELSPQAAVLAH